MFDFLAKAALLWLAFLEWVETHSYSREYLRHFLGNGLSPDFGNGLKPIPIR
jgi:hypothetical protein